MSTIHESVDLDDAIDSMRNVPALYLGDGLPITDLIYTLLLEVRDLTNEVKDLRKQLE